MVKSSFDPAAEATEIRKVAGPLPTNRPSVSVRQTHFLLLRPLRSLIFERIRSTPQFAYTAGRSHKHALRRVFLHCYQARESCASQMPTLRERIFGATPTKLYGALQVSVDLTQAFDRMPRHLLLKSMTDFGLPESLIGVIMAWHSHAIYTVD